MFKRLYQVWALPALLSLFIFIFTRPVLAQLASGDLPLQTAINDQTLITGSQTIDGYQQVYYQTPDGHPKFVTQKNLNSIQSSLSGEYLVWATQIDGAGQIFRHHIPTDTTIQLTHSSTNLNPQVDSLGNVVWERWVIDSWQIYLFDGSSIRPLTTYSTSVHPEIENGYVVWSTRDPSGLWKTTAYSIAMDKQVDITVGQTNKYTSLKNGQIDLSLESATQSSKVHLSTFFQLDLGPLGIDQPLPTPILPPEPPSLTYSQVNEILDANSLLDEADMPESTEATPSATPTP